MIIDIINIPLYISIHSGWFAMTVDSTSFFGPTATLESKPLLPTSPRCQVRFSYYHNQTVGGSTYIGVKVIEDYGVNTTSVIYSDVYQQMIESVDEWRVMYVGVGARPPGMLYLSALLTPPINGVPGVIRTGTNKNATEFGLIKRIFSDLNIFMLF